MQRERGGLESFPETIDLNQGSIPNTTPMDQSDSWDSMMNPVENRLSNYMLSSSGGNVNATRSYASNDHSSSFSFWDRGESSSSMPNIPDGDDSKTRLGWSPTLYAPSSGADVRPDNWAFEPSGSTMHSYNSSRGSLNASSSHGYFRERDDHHRGLPHSFHKSEIETGSPFYASSSNVGTALGSSSSFSEINDAPGSSFGNWGSSCKRKALEGTTSEQLYPGGSSSLHPSPTCYPDPRNLNISSSGTLNMSPSNHMEHGVPNNVIPPCSFPLSNVAENSSRNISVRSSHGRQESVLFDMPRGASVRRFGVTPAPSSQPLSNPDLSELRTPMSPHLNSNSSSRSHLGHANESRGMHSYPWDGSFGSRGSGSSREEANIRTSSRNNLEYLMGLSSPETRSTAQDQIDWSFAPGNSVSSRNQSSGPRISLSSGSQASSSGWLPHENQTSQHLSEMAPWVPFPHPESESGSRRRHFTILPPTSSSSEDTAAAAASSRRAQHQLRRSSAAFLMENMAGDEANGWRALAAVEGRHRLIRQVLNAMRRGGGHLPAEDYMFIDPFITGIAEMHDRHRDMRLDVDNMSYEELLALEERIGNVSTGLSEEKIMGSMKQRKHGSMEVSPNLEPCCICQENYVGGDDVGILDCGHEFHTICIKQWLALKNLCPVCKNQALET